MRNHLWLLSAFSVAASLSLGVTGAEAKKTEGSHVRQVHRALDVGKKDPSSWVEARLQAIFIQGADGKYSVEELPGGKNVNTKLPMASIQKIVAAEVVFDALAKKEISLTDMVPILDETWSFPDSNFARVGLPKGIKEMPVSAALAHTIKLSSNPMIRNLGIFVAGSKEEFVARMNRKVKMWEMDDTYFVTESGLPGKNRVQGYSTAKDLLILLQHILPHIAQYREYIYPPLPYWNPPTNRTARQIAREKAEKELIELGVVFKTGTVDGCKSAVAMTEKAFDIRLCIQGEDQFSGAIQAFKYTFPKAVNTPLETVSPPIISTVSSRQAQP
ncbi:MAG: hypothetical protein A3B66_03865 [Alphaproteobacteria bacterium RIFCSPHIGHO2_02_FULL_46_13]|nr:MAG: hypothetical protein A3B66_03865 [Alphaproteobacteria bacterium RIFCSPHIGHO2_02_FULL_46_13]